MLLLYSFDKKKCIQIQPPWNLSDQGQLVTLAKGPLLVVYQQFQRTFPLKLLHQYQLNSICGLQAKGERKAMYLGQDMTKMTAMPI